MPRRARIEINAKELTGNSAAIRDKFDDGMFVIMKKIATDSQSHMRQNAPWTDRTANARNGLRATPVHGGYFSTRYKHEHAVIVYHTMPYGFWLENRWNGKYAIMDSTVQLFGPKAMKLASGLLGSLTNVR